jgi:hypothetical protein
MKAGTPSDSAFAHFKESMRKLLSVSKSELDEIRKQEAAKKRLAKAKRRSAA